MPVGGHHRQVGILREGDDLGDIDAGAIRPQFGGQGVAAHEGDGHKDGVNVAAGLGDDFGHRAVGANHNDGFGVGDDEVQQGGFDGAGVALVVPGADGGQVAPGQGGFGAAQAGAAVGVVLVDDGDAGDAQVLGEARHYFLGFLVVGGAHIEDVVQAGVAQELGAGEGGDEGDAAGLRHRHGGAGGGGADFANQGENGLFLNEVAGVVVGAVGFVAVVVGGEFQHPAVDAAAAVDFREGGDYAEAHLGAQDLGRAAGGGGLAENDAAGEYAGVGGGLRCRHCRGREGVARRGQDGVVRAAGDGEEEQAGEGEPYRPGQDGAPPGSNPVHS